MQTVNNALKYESEFKIFASVFSETLLLHSYIIIQVIFITFYN